MSTFGINPNIIILHRKKIWDKLDKSYAEMPYWKGFVDGCPQWYSEKNWLKARLSLLDWNYMRNSQKKNGVSGYNFSKMKQLLY